MAGAAFFDLDKTLMEGSSALHFARAALQGGQTRARVSEACRALDEAA